MAGRLRARRAEVERDMTLAWTIEALHRQKKLESLRHYLGGDDKVDATRGSGAVLGALRSLAAQGKAVITKVARGE